MAFTVRKEGRATFTKMSHSIYISHSKGDESRERTCKERERRGNQQTITNLILRTATLIALEIPSRESDDANCNYIGSKGTGENIGSSDMTRLMPLNFLALL